MALPLSWTQLFLLLNTTAVLGRMVRVLYKQRNVGTAFAWLIVLFAFPLFGVLAYLLVGEPRLGTAQTKRAAEMNRFYTEFAQRHLADVDLDTTERLKPRYHGISKVAAVATGLGATQNNAMTLLSTTDSILDAMLADIEAAQQSCLLAFYIIEPKGRIETLLEAVERAARRDVYCVILADTVGSQNFFAGPWPARLQEAGVEVQAALPVGLWRTLFTRSDLRNHRKLLIVDKKPATPAASIWWIRTFSNKTPASANGWT